MQTSRSVDIKAERYLQRQNKEQREIIERIRNLILINFPQIHERGMEEGLWYDGKFYIATFKDHVNLGVCINGLSEEDIRHFEGKGKTQRHLKFFSTSDVKEEKLLPLMELIDEKAVFE